MFPQKRICLEWCIFLGVKYGVGFLVTIGIECHVLLIVRYLLYESAV